MLQKYDKVLLIARIICVVLIGFLFVVVFAVSIYGMIELHWAFVFLIPVGWFSVWVLWVFLRLILSFFCDVKMIRNKLYEKENDYFAEYLQDGDLLLRVGGKSRKPIDLQKNAEANEELRSLQQRLDLGDITPKEYEARKEELLKIIKGENEE